jgi:hypothetical protein
MRDGGVVGATRWVALSNFWATHRIAPTIESKLKDYGFAPRLAYLLARNHL